MIFIIHSAAEKTYTLIIRKMSTRGIVSNTIHKHICNLDSIVWSNIFEWLTLNGILLLLETGDSRIGRIIRHGLQNLQLKRTQTRYKPFPVSLLNSFSNIRSLSIHTNQNVDSELSENFPHLSKTLRSLKISSCKGDVPGITSLIDKLLLSASNDYSESMLSELIIDVKNEGSLIRTNLQETDCLGNVLQQLPNLTTFVCEYEMHSSIIAKIPKSISNLRVKLHTSTPIKLEPVHFPNLLTMKFKNDGNIERFQFITVILPETLTDLDICTNDDNIWNMLPPKLTSLQVKGLKPETNEQVLNIPRSVKHLSVSGDLEPELLLHLPYSLKTLINNMPQARFTSVDTSTLPSSLTNLDMFCMSSCVDWKLLPRGLISTSSIDSPFRVSYTDELSFIGDLPTSITSMNLDAHPHITSKDLYNIPSKKVLRRLFIKCNRDMECLDAFCSRKGSETNGGSVFPLLETLVIVIPSVDFDLFTKFHLPSLTELKISSSRAKNLTTLTLPNTLKKLHLSHRAQDSEIPCNALPSFLLLLPPNLTYLGLSNYFIDTMHPSFQCLPKTLVYASFSVVKETFSFEHLSYLPNTIETLRLYLTDSEGFIIRTCLKEILTSLPRYINCFVCDRSSSRYRIPRLRVILLEDCSWLSDTDTESLKIDTFRRFSPPFMNKFDSYLIDPGQVFDKAMKIMQKPL